MTSLRVCRHGLLTLERNGARIHSHDGSRCEASIPGREAPPEPEAPVATEAAAPTEAPPEVVPVPAPAAPLAYETVQTAHATDPGFAERARTAARRSRPWLVVGAVAAVVLLVAAGVVGGLVARNAVDQEKQRTATAEQRARSVEDKLAGKDATIEGQRGQISEYEQRQSALERREAELEQREQALQQPAGPNATSFGDGIYQARVAIQPGEYRTEGTDGCYWAKLSTGDTNSIIENNLVVGPQTVTVDSPYFESENCGTWSKITNE